MNRPTHQYIPKHAIWFQTNPILKACITRINGRCTFQVFYRSTGREIYKGERDRFREAKNEVLDYFEVGDY